MSNKPTERWQNVYKGAVTTSSYHNTKELADEYRNHRITRTHYLVTYWNEEGIIEDVKLIKIGE